MADVNELNEMLENVIVVKEMVKRFLLMEQKLP